MAVDNPTAGDGPKVATPAAAYREFWNEVGDTFPDLGGALSTRFYFENEKRLLSESVGDVAGQLVLKTDLWDEVKNSRILQWVERQGAAVVGIDISLSTVRQARTAFGTARLLGLVADVRRLPFRPGTFDVVYSMGTVEHFDETQDALDEIASVLRAGGAAVVGVPNRWDPFLRPLSVALLGLFGQYGYGYEKSYSRRALRRMLTSAGLRVESETAILFVPGWLRMFELWCHTRGSRLERPARWAIRVFVWLDRHAPQVRRHGYLLASTARRH